MAKQADIPVGEICRQKGMHYERKTRRAPLNQKDKQKERADNQTGIPKG